MVPILLLRNQKELLSYPFLLHKFVIFYETFRYDEKYTYYDKQNPFLSMSYSFANSRMKIQESRESPKGLPSLYSQKIYKVRVEKTLIYINFLCCCFFLVPFLKQSSPRFKSCPNVSRTRSSYTYLRDL